jgi:hypothetical protein
LHDTKDVKAYDTVKGSSHDDFKVKKSSNNILDLVEVGDLVAHRFWGETESIIKEMRCETDINWHVKQDVVVSGEITSIYKRQPNGDYKRYIVGDNK